MPFIVTTKRTDNQPFDPAQANIWRPVSRRAVATLEGARKAAVESCIERERMGIGPGE